MTTPKQAARRTHAVAIHLTFIDPDKFDEMWRMNPSLLAWQIDLVPSQTCYVGSPEASGQSEDRHVFQMSGQLLKQHRRLVVG